MRTTYRLTENLIKTLCREPQHATGHDYFDSQVQGLCICIRPSGAASWCLRYRADGVQKRLTMGRFPGVSVEAARKAARKYLGEIADGRDPAGEKQARRQRDVSGEAYIARAEQFVRLHGMVKTRGWREQARVLGLRLSPISARQLANPRPGDPPAVFVPIMKDGSLAKRWAKKLARDITKSDVSDAIDELMPAFPGAANHRLAHLKSMFSWLASKGHIDEHPFKDMPKPAIAVERNRVLTPDEIRLVWLATAALKAPFRQYVRVLMLTGQRRNEVARMEWSEIAGNTWLIPAARYKTGAKTGDHDVPLTAMALAELQSLPRRGRFVFTSDRHGATAISCFSDIKEDLDAAILEIAGAPIDHYTPHDFRRTAASTMGDLGILPHHIEAVIGHKSGAIKGIAKVYNRAKFTDERRAALTAWADFISKLANGDEPKAAVAPSNIVRAFATA